MSIQVVPSYIAHCRDSVEGELRSPSYVLEYQEDLSSPKDSCKRDPPSFSKPCLVNQIFNWRCTVLLLAGKPLLFSDHL